MKRFSKHVFALSLLSFGGCLAETDSEPLTDDDLESIESAIDLPPTAPAFTACLSNAAHATITIPQALGEQPNNEVRANTATGGYADESDGCAYFIADFQQYPYSNYGFHVAFGGRARYAPTTQSQCEAYRATVRVHTRLSGSSYSATPRFVNTVPGRWFDGHCIVDTGNFNDYDAPSTGWAMHRVLVRVHVNGVAQPAQAFAGDPAPE